MENSEKPVEVQSEKIRNMVGKAPSYLLRSGVYITGLFLFSILICLYLLPYTNSYTTKIIIKSCPEVDYIYAPFDGRLTYSEVSDSIIDEGIPIAIVSNDVESKEMKSKTEGKLLFAQKSNTHIGKGKLVCGIIPSEFDKIYGEFYLPIQYEDADLKHCEITITAKGRKKITGRVNHIYPFIYSFSNKQYIKIEVDICSEIHSLFPIDGEVEVIFSRRSFLTQIFAK